MSDARHILAAAAAPLAVIAPPEPEHHDVLNERDGLDGSSRRHLARSVNVYIVSTGLDASHPEFGGRALFAYDAFRERAWWDGGFDPHGHGTWLASIVGGNTYGVTRSTSLHGVRAFDARGVTTQETIEDALTWIAVNHVKPAVALLPFAFDASPDIDHVAERLVWAGVTVVTAAGDSASSAARRSPARNPAMITVGAVDRWHVRAPWSAFGSCIDLYAPGEEVMAAGKSPDEPKILNGTAAAAAIVAGTAAAQLQADSFLSPHEVRARLLADATTETPRANMAETGSRWSFDGACDPAPGGPIGDGAGTAPPTQYRLDRSSCWADIDRDRRYGFTG